MASEPRTTSLPLAVLALCALVVTGLLVRREFFTGIGPGGADPWTQAPRSVNNWGKLAAEGHRVGSPTSSVTVAVFGDLECPACRAFELGALRKVVARHGDAVATVYHHFPLSYHPMARQAALGAECAAAQSSFKSFHDRVLEQQDSLATKSIVAFAMEAGIRDSAEFTRCLASDRASALVDAGTALGQTVPVRGTPTIIVNGKVLPAIPDEARLDSIVRGMLGRAGR